MDLIKGMGLIISAGYITAMIVIGPVTAYGEDSSYRKNLPDGVYMELTKEFYDALRKEDSSGKKVYSSDSSRKYLKEVAVAARLMVETNQKIIKQHEKMIQLLETLVKEWRKGR